MAYKIILTDDAEQDFDRYLNYLLFIKKNEQAASNLLNDFEATLHSLSQIASSLKLCDNPRLKELGYRPNGVTVHTGSRSIKKGLTYITWAI